MITFAHIWKTDPATGLLRCFRRPVDRDTPVLAEALAKRMRNAVCHAAVSGVEIGGAQLRLHGHGKINGDGVAALLDRLEELNRSYVDAMANTEDEFTKIIEGWPNGAPADYLEAKEASQKRFKEQYPNADPKLFDLF